MSGGGSGNRAQFIANLVDQRLNQHPGWPANIFKLECETYGTYQNVTGNVLKDLDNQNEVAKVTHQVNGGTRRFFARPGRSSLDGTDIYVKTKRIYEFLEQSGHFANLTAYVALCKIYDELQPYIDMDVLPEGNWHHLIQNSGGRVPDGLLSIPREYAPVEVYNGADYLSRQSGKYSQVMDLASDEDDHVNSHPILINRRADEDVRNDVRKRNGMVVDTDCIVTSEDTYSQYNTVIDLFKLDPIIHDIPPLEAANGDTLDGEDYDDLGTDSDSARVLRPPSEMIEDVDELPDQYLKRIRGGIQLLYVNSIYRRSDDQLRRDACYVLQAIYNLLLRHGGLDRTTALNEGWDEAKKQYRRIRNAGPHRQMILDETRTLLEDLREERIITERNGKLHARKATHPQPSL